jgi:hypothetical protein
VRPHLLHLLALRLHLRCVCMLSSDKPLLRTRLLRQRTQLNLSLRGQVSMRAHRIFGPGCSVLLVAGVVTGAKREAPGVEAGQRRRARELDRWESLLEMLPAL